MSAYTNFKIEWNTHRVDYDHVFYYQCVDLILEYMKEVGHVAAGISGNAIDYWYHPSPALVNACVKIAKTDLIQGDIVCLAPIDAQPIHAEGHIGLLDSKTVTTVRPLEQNALGTGDGLGKNAIGVYRDIPMTRVLGGWRPKSTIPAPNPGGTATVLREAYVRISPTTSAALGGSKLLKAGETFQYKAKVQGQWVNENGVNTNIWYESVLGHYVWSGNCKG